MNETTPLLELEDLRITYEGRDRTVRAVDGVSLRLGSGDSLGLAGESGCGKSTIALACLGLLPDNARVEGAVRFKGDDMIGAKPGRWRALRWAGISIVFQGAMSALNPVKRIGDQIAEAILIHDRKASPRSARKGATELLEHVGIPARRASDYPHEFSGGMRQRAMIAMALACDPPLVIADEPTTALDVMIQAQILNLLDRLRAELNLSLMLITHDLSVIAQIVDRVAIMKDGKIIEEGLSTEVLSAPTHEYSKKLVDSFPKVGDAHVRHAPGERTDDERGSIHLRDLNVHFETRGSGIVRAVDGVSVDVVPGEVFCIAGESGCGKTTLGRTILGLAHPTSGSIEVGGMDPSALRGAALKRFRRTVQVVFQDPMGSLNPRQTVYEVVAEPIRIHELPGHEEELVARSLARAGLRPPEEYFMSYPHELSGGQRQRVVIASALALDPEILIGDEPVSMLDASVRGEIMRLLLDLKRDSGLTLVLITHDLGFAWALADRVAIMYLGRIVELGPPDEVLVNPKHPYTKALLEVVPEIAVRDHKPVLSGEPPDPARIPQGCRFHPRCPLYNSGTLPAEIEARCTGEDPGLLDVGHGHGAACHAVTTT